MVLATHPTFTNLHAKIEHFLFTVSEQNIRFGNGHHWVGFLYPLTDDIAIRLDIVLNDNVHQYTHKRLAWSLLTYSGNLTLCVLRKDKDGDYSRPYCKDSYPTGVLGYESYRFLMGRDVKRLNDHYFMLSSFNQLTEYLYSLYRHNHELFGGDR